MTRSGPMRRREISYHFNFLACVAVTFNSTPASTSEKQRRYPCCGPLKDLTNNQKCVSNFILIGKSTMTFLNRLVMACTQILVHKWGPTELQGFRRCFADGLYQCLVSSVTQATFLSGWSYPLLFRPQLIKVLLTSSISLSMSCVLYFLDERLLLKAFSQGQKSIL